MTLLLLMTMWGFQDKNIPVPTDYFLQPGYIYVTVKPTQISTVLGSSVAVCLYDRKRKIGGMNHFQYPQAVNRAEATARYGNVSTITLIRMMKNDGSNLKHLEAQIFGGAHNPEFSSKNIGRENILIVKRILARERVKVVSEDVGGERGRKIVYDTTNNQVAVVKVEKIRQGDWYPYESNR